MKKETESLKKVLTNAMKLGTITDASIDSASPGNY